MQMDLSQRRKGAKKRIEVIPFWLCAFAPLREIFLVLILACVAINTARSAELVPPKAAEPRDDSALYSVTTIASGLNRPTSLAVRGGGAAVAPFQLYVAEAGAARVVRVAAEAGANAAPVITGFPLGGHDVYFGANLGPLGVVFITANRLLVGTGGLEDSGDLLRVYDIEANVELTYDAADHSTRPLGVSNRSKEGSFASVAASESACFVAPHSGDARGWVLKATVDANHVAGLEPFVAMADLGIAGRPSAVAVNPRANYHYVLVASGGELDGSPDSRLTMLTPKSGDAALALAPGLRDITAIAYSPDNDLYVADFAAEQPSAGGVYRLEAAQVDGRESCRAVKIASVERPTALAFTPDGALYVTTLGDAGGATGAIVCITPDENTPPL
jgi:DNA-binding beta-propeller fold protein YncE